MLTAIVMTAALTLGQCAGGSCAMPSGGAGFGFSAPMASFYAPPAAYAPPAYAYAPPAQAYAPPVAQAAAIPPPSSRRWSMADGTGKWWCNDDLGQLVAHIDRVNAKLTRQAAPAATRVVWMP